MTRRRYVPDWRTLLVMWLAWHMPREVVYWCTVRVILYAANRLPGKDTLTTKEILEIWEEQT